MGGMPVLLTLSPLPLGDIIFAHLTSPLNDIICCLHQVQGKTIDIESLQNRLLKVCYVPATSVSLNRLLFFYFCCSR
jgi:hypothetical protein